MEFSSSMIYNTTLVMAFVLAMVLLSNKCIYNKYTSSISILNNPEARE